jgi:hypothetical protein
MKVTPGLWVLAFDIHYPKVHKPTFNAMLDFLDKNKVVGFAFGGDQHDNAEISHHNKRRIIFRETGSYKKNTEGFERDILGPIESRTKEARRVWIDGNHEHWERQLVEANPELEGTIERNLLYNLQGGSWEYYETGTGFDIGKLHVVHGETLKGTNHAKNAVDTFAQSVAYGHFHTIQSFTKVLPQAKQDKWTGFACPALCETNPVYLRNAPHAWINGFTIVEVAENGNFNLYQIVVTKGQFNFGGKTYGKRV